MAKLSEEMLEEGRTILSNGLDGNYKQACRDMEDWIDRSKVRIDKNVVLDTFRKCLMANDSEKAIKMFNASFANADPAAERIELLGIVTKLGCSIFFLVVFLLGCLGGIVYLLNWLF